jgi:hypothetical protein
MKKIIIGAIVALILTACGPGIKGKYGNNMAVYDFHSDGTVDQESMGITARMKYKVDGKNIELQTPNGTLIYEIEDDSSIKTPFGVLKKQ